MLPVCPFQQSRAMCGPAALKMVLQYFGVEKTEKELAKIAGSTLAMGTTAEGLACAAHVLGFQAHIKDQCTLADIRHSVRQKIPVIVDWFLGDDGHYAVVVGITRKHITLQDPAIGRRRRMDLQTFQRVWFDFAPPYIRTKNDLILRRMIVVEPKKMRPPLGGAQRGAIPPRT